MKTENSFAKEMSGRDAPEIQIPEAPKAGVLKAEMEREDGNKKQEAEAYREMAAHNIDQNILQLVYMLNRREGKSLDSIVKEGVVKEDDMELSIPVNGIEGNVLISDISIQLKIKQLLNTYTQESQDGVSTVYIEAYINGRLDVADVAKIVNANDLDVNVEDDDWSWLQGDIRIKLNRNNDGVKTDVEIGEYKAGFTELRPADNSVTMTDIKYVPKLDEGQLNRILEQVIEKMR